MKRLIMRAAVVVLLAAATGAVARPKTPEECREQAKRFEAACEKMCGRNSPRDAKRTQNCRKLCRDQAPALEKGCTSGKRPY